MTFLRSSYLIIFVVMLLSINLGAMEQKSRAGVFLRQVTKQDTLPMYDKGNLIKYLQERIENSSAQGEERKKEVSRSLTSDFVWLFVLNYLDTNADARVVFYFPLMVEENRVSRLRRELGCYTTNLTEDEQAYASTLQKVTKEEYVKRLENKFNADDLETMKLDESKKLAEDILLLLKS